ncbi:MmgE/PrpD family protein [Gordonia sp. CPCC 205515]|uniref:MmgE/PrpD family protein n=1 Tax=Gordonia sp. CPCC 205515 TaxID=3140791 RepID=UPI003AF37254
MTLAESPPTVASVVSRLATWARDYAPTAEDLALADRALQDTAAVTLAARDHPISRIVAGMPEGARWSTLGHVLDFDDLHLESTTHISVVIVPTVLACGGDASAYLAGAGVMARLGMALGWPHYSSGWHATCTAGAPAAAVAAGLTMGLDDEQLATAIALAIPAAGGVQAAFGSHAKSLQVGFAVDAGIRAAALAQAGASANPAAVDDWLSLVGGDPARLIIDGPAVPGGLAIKQFPCCYAMQRPIAALRDVADRLPADVDAITGMRVSTPGSGMQPLIHDNPTTGLAAKFSMPYAVATGILDDYSGFAEFYDDAVLRPAAQQLMSRVRVEQTPTGSNLLDGEVTIVVETADGSISTSMANPPGSPTRPPTRAEMVAKFASCGVDVPDLVTDLTWQAAPQMLRENLTATTHAAAGAPPARR